MTEAGTTRSISIASSRAYIVERFRLEARKKSYLTTEQPLADGSIIVEIDLGGQA
jgi:hypothetical protein